MTDEKAIVARPDANRGTEPWQTPEVKRLNAGGAENNVRDTGTDGVSKAS